MIRIDHYHHVEMCESRVFQEWQQMAQTLADVKAKLITLQTDVTAQRTVIDSVKTLLEGLSMMIAQLKQQIADLIAAGGNPVQVQALVDQVAAIETALTDGTGQLAAAVTQNTPPA